MDFDFTGVTAKTKLEFPAFDPEKIDPEENILSPVFGEEQLNRNNIRIKTNPAGKNKDL